VFGVEDAHALEPLAEALRRLLRLGDLPLSTLWMGFLSERPERQEKWYAHNLLKPRKQADVLLYEAIRARRATQQGETERDDVLGMLLAARDEDGSPMSDEEVRDELVTALVAGHETTAITLAWAVQAIASHPEVRERLEAELREAGFVGEGGALDVERLGELEYLDAVIKETLRLRPVIAVVGRVLQVPMLVDGREIPAHTIVAPCVYLTHHDEQYYSEPEAFRPERFLGHTPEPDIWLPFGGGIRRCIGAAFASVEMKVVLATVLSRARLELVEQKAPRVVRRAIAFAPRGGVRVRVAAAG
jgi:cytochrome P450